MVPIFRISLVSICACALLFSVSCGSDDPRNDPGSSTGGNSTPFEVKIELLSVGIISFWTNSQGMAPDDPGNHSYTFELLKKSELTLEVQSEDAPGHIYLKDEDGVVVAESEDGTHVSTLTIEVDNGTYTVVPTTQSAGDEGLFRVKIKGNIADVRSETLFCTESTPCPGDDKDEQIVPGVCTRTVEALAGIEGAAPTRFLCDVNHDRADLHVEALKDSTIELPEMANDNGVGLLTLHQRADYTITEHLYLFLGDSLVATLDKGATQTPECGLYATGTRTILVDEGGYRWRSQAYEHGYSAEGDILACSAADLEVKAGECKLIDVSPTYTYCVGEFGENDDVYYTEENQGLWFVQPEVPNGVQATWEDARARCDNVIWAGRDDWVLPTIDQWRTWFRDCPATESGGECAATAECTDAGACLDGPLCRCPHKEGCYIDGLVMHLFDWGICTGKFWTSTSLDDPEKAYRIDIDYAAVETQTKTETAGVMCVRKP